MPFTPRLDDEWAPRRLARWTSPAHPPALIGRGMEGVVYALDDERVAKVWFAATPAALQAARDFQEALAGAGLPFATPRILELDVVDAPVVTVERRLAGIPLTELCDRGAVTPAGARAVVVDVLAALAAAGPLPAARTLSVLGETPPFHRDGEDFPSALQALVRRRAARSRSVLDAALPDLERLVAALTARLAEADSGRRAVVHGDLIPANVLVDDGATATAVLDWGFLTTEGDPAFDAAVTAAVFDMYGPDALPTELRLLDELAERLDHDRTALLVYRAAYSLITATAYDPDGCDGHFAWCVRALTRPDVVAAVFG